MASDSTTRTDVVVIGAGAIGCASALYLSERGHSVVVLESDSIGRGASYGNAGHVTPGDSMPLASPGVVGMALRWSMRPNSPFSLNWGPNAAYASWLLAFARWSRRSVDSRVDALKALADLSLDLMKDMPEEDRKRFEFRQSGVLNVYQSEQGLQAGLATADKLAAHGVGVEVLDENQVRERARFDGEVEGGVLFPGDAQCNPFEYVRYLAAAATDRGADFREGLRVLSLEQRPDGSYEVITAEGVVNAKKVVLAAGAAIPGIARGLGAKVPIIGGGGYSVDIELEPEPILPLLFHEHRVAVNSIGGRTRVAGLMEIGKSMPAVNRRKADYLLRTSQEVFPNAQIFNPGPVWSGIRPCTPDGVPIIGQVPGHDNVIVAGGHAMVGITLSAGTGRLVADLVDEQPLQIAPAAFAIDRF